MNKPLSEKNIRDLAAAKRAPMTEFLRLAVVHSNPCTPEGEGGAGSNAQDLIAAKLAEIGLRPHVWVPKKPAGTHLSYDHRPNVVAVWKGSGAAGTPGPKATATAPGSTAGRSLALNSHADIVGPADLTAWTRPPFSGALEDGFVYGRGSCDAKASLVTYLFAIEALRDAGYEPAGDIVFQSVADEEGGGAGAVECARRFPTDGVLIGEPTGLEVMPGTRGAAALLLHVHGREAHSGVAFTGVNAILGAQKYISAITALQERLDATRRNPLWDGHPAAHVFNVATIKGGKFGGVVPETCEVGVTCGCIGGESTADLKGWVEAALEEVTRSDPWLAEHPPQVTWTQPCFEPSACDPDHPLVRLLARSAEETLARRPVIRAMPAGTDLRAFLEAGIPGANFGPGPLDQGHSANEHVAVAEMEKALAVLLRFIPTWTSGAA